jgi:hypothetical protein
LRHLRGSQAVTMEGTLADGLVGWLVSVVGATVSRKVRNATFGVPVRKTRSVRR